VMAGAPNRERGRAARVQAAKKAQAMKSFLYTVLRRVVWTLIVIAAMVTALVAGLALGNYFHQPPPKDPYCDRVYAKL
jgi:hypothetical protein